MSNSIFNTKKNYFDLLPLLGYINVPDLFIRKFLLEAIGKYSDTTENTSCHLTLQSGHLNSKKIKNDFLLLINIIIDKLNVNDQNKQILKEKMIICFDNASSSLSIVFEFNKTTTTTTIVSTPNPPEKQSSVHTRKKIYEQLYMAGTLSLFNDNKYDLYTIAGRGVLFDAINKAKESIEIEEKPVIGFYIHGPELSNDYDIQKLLLSEALQYIQTLTGFEIREDDVQNFSENYIFVLKNKTGFYLRLSDYIR